MWKHNLHERPRAGIRLPLPQHVDRSIRCIKIIRNWFSQRRLISVLLRVVAPRVGSLNNSSRCKLLSEMIPVIDGIDMVAILSRRSCFTSACWLPLISISSPFDILQFVNRSHGSSRRSFGRYVEQLNVLGPVPIDSLRRVSVQNLSRKFVNASLCDMRHKMHLSRSCLKQTKKLRFLRNKFCSLIQTIVRNSRFRVTMASLIWWIEPSFHVRNATKRDERVREYDAGHFFGGRRFAARFFVPNWIEFSQSLCVRCESPLSGRTLGYCSSKFDASSIRYCIKKLALSIVRFLSSWLTQTCG